MLCSVFNLSKNFGVYSSSAYVVDIDENLEAYFKEHTFLVGLLIISLFLAKESENCHTMQIPRNVIKHNGPALYH